MARKDEFDLCKECDERHAAYALCAINRYEELGKAFRERRNPRDEKCTPRSAYHRDRDRIIWSNAFRRLQNKTQIFPHYVDDHYKRRLTHTLEVSNIATSLARRLGLNEVATEAIALGHDLGHTPFGHAGETALNDELMRFFPDPITEPIPLRGFNHCAHGIEIVSRIEKHKIDVGLNLTFDIRDGILKHICSYTSARDLKTKPFSSRKNIVKCDLYRNYKDNYGSLEAQCVWFADKLSYLLGDIEDGLRSGILSGGDLWGHEFVKSLVKLFKKDVDAWEHPFKKRAAKERAKMSNPNTDPMERFYYLRNKAQGLLIKNCDLATKKRLKALKKPVKCVADILACNSRLVHVADNLKTLWYQFYKQYMVNNLFQNRYVLEANYKARV